MTRCCGRGEVSLEMPAGIDLYWLPLGAGGHSVRLNGKVYEAAELLASVKGKMGPATAADDEWWQGDKRFPPAGRGGRGAAPRH